MIGSIRTTIRRYFAAWLVLLMVAQAAPGLAHAEEQVTGIQLDPVPTPLQLYVEDGTYTLNLWATLKDGASPVNVTADASWSSSSSHVKVNKGVLSATGEVASAVITAKYKTFTASAIVKADYRYAGLKLKLPGGADAPDRMDIELGNSLDLEAVAAEWDGTEVPSTDESQWLTSNSAVATVDKGEVTLVGPGSVTITAKLKGRSDSIQLNVTSPYQSLNISHASAGDSVELVVGQADYVLHAMAVPKNGGTPIDITSDAEWTSSNSSVAKVDKGVVTPAGAGKAVITVKRYGVSASITFYVRTPYEALIVTPAKPLSMTLHAGEIEVQAKAMKGTTQQADVASEADWTVADPLVASVNKTGGKVTVEPKSPGRTKLTVSYKGLNAELPITVYPTIKTVEASKDSLDVYADEQGALPAVKGISLTDDEYDITGLVSWKSSDPAVITVEDGKWVAKQPGTAVLTAEVENEPSTAKVTDTVEVRVHKKVQLLLADTGNLSVVVGKESDLPRVTLIYADGEEKEVSDLVEWTSSSPNVLVKPGKVKGLQPASATLTGKYLDKKVTVKVLAEEEFTTINVEPKSLELTLNRSKTIKVTGFTKSGKKVTLSGRVTWTADSDRFVQVNGSSVKGLAEGSGKLTAFVQGKKLEVPYTVKAKLVRLSASDTSLKMSVGQSETVKLTAHYENGRIVDVTSSAVWSTNKANTASVSNGTIKAAGKGTASVKAAFEGKTVTIRITVK